MTNKLFQLVSFVLIFFSNLCLYSQETNFAKKFSRAENDSLFILNYPNTKIEKYFVEPDSYNQLSFGDSMIFNQKLKTVLGPYYQDEKTFYIKIIKIDSAYKVHVGNIWLSNLKMDSIKRYKIANEILSEPRLFDKYCHKFSHDKNKLFDCEILPVVAYAFVEPFATETSIRKKGEIYIVETKFGTHVVKSLSDPVKDRARVECIFLYY